MESREVVYAGRVQGVGFRRKCHQIAGSFNIQGTVENLKDGSVLIQVNGPAGEIDKFLSEVKKHFKDNITNETIRTLAHNPSAFEGFRIRY